MQQKPKVKSHFSTSEEKGHIGAVRPNWNLYQTIINYNEMTIERGLFHKLTPKPKEANQSQKSKSVIWSFKFQLT